MTKKAETGDDPTGRFHGENGLDVDFPEGFHWGTGTAAYQNEGNNTNSQWHHFEQKRITEDGNHAGQACGWWDNPEPDFDLAKSLGHNSMRISLGWDRIEPAQGVFDDEALSRYARMIAALTERGIEPVVTLHHFSHPQWFEELGGFEYAGCAELFARYTERVLDRLGPQCRIWVTINEPNIVAAMGYFTGEHPPARQADIRAVFKVTRNMARCHAEAYRIIHAARPDALVSFTNHFLFLRPERKSSLMDHLVVRIISGLLNDSFTRIVVDGKLPLFRRRLRRSLKGVAGTFDFLGINIYGRFNVKFSIREVNNGFMQMNTPPGTPTGDLDPHGRNLYGECYPQGIREVVDRYRKHRKPFYVMETGVQDRDDLVRPWVLAQGVLTVAALLAEGVPILGYHHWTLVDNFEWAFGWNLHFGLVALDRETLERKPRPSARLLKEIIAGNRITRDLLKEYVP